MHRSPDLAECAASLLEADPRLVRVLGLRDASANGHRRVLPVLTVDAGEWSPPQRDELGAGTVALTVLDGWLTDGELLLGPRDTFDPWTERWTVCTHVRMAVIGDAFAGALRTWPHATTRPPDAPRTRVPANDGAIEDRVLELLWRIALRWGFSAAGGVVLPETIDSRSVGMILDEPKAGLALATLATRGVKLRRGALHLLTLSGSEVPRRDALRAAATQQLALARAAHDDCLALCELLGVGLRGRAAHVPTQKTSMRPDRVRASQVRASTGGAAGGRIPTQAGRSAPPPARGQRQVLGHRLIGVRSLPDKFLPSPFRCDVDAGSNGAVRIRPVGELDMSTVASTRAGHEGSTRDRPSGCS